jgi:SAM-dependent methyltransferase
MEEAYFGKHHKTKIIKTWNEYNKALSNVVEYNLTIKEFLEEVRKFICTDINKILEVGCSNGRYLIFFKGYLRAKELVGIDIIKSKTISEFIKFI